MDAYDSSKLFPSKLCCVSQSLTQRDKRYPLMASKMDVTHETLAATISVSTIHFT